MVDYSRLMHVCQLFNNQKFNIFGGQNWGEYEQLEQTVRPTRRGSASAQHRQTDLRSRSIA